MPDEHIFYIFSRRTPPLRNKLLQRDRLSDFRIHLKVIDRIEVKTIIGCHAQRTDPPCPSAILVLAALLRPQPFQFPLKFDFSLINKPFVFYTFNFEARQLPPPPHPSFGFNILFAFPIQSASTMAVELSQFIFQVSDDIASISTGIELWDLTYRVDQNHVLGVLQFETRCRHEKIQIEGKFYTESRIATNIRTLESTFYLTSGPEGPLSTYVVDELMGYINSSIRDLTKGGNIYRWESRAVLLQ